MSHIKNGAMFDRTIDNLYIASVLKDKLKLKEPIIARAVSASEKSGSFLEKTAVELGFTPEDILYKAIAVDLGIDFISAPYADPAIIRGLGLDIDYLERCELVPLHETDGRIAFAVSTLRDVDTLKTLKFYTKSDVSISLAAPTSVRRCLSKFRNDLEPNQTKVASDVDVEKLRESANDGPIIKLVGEIVADASDQFASDIHLEAFENGARVRFRVDGVLRTVRTVSQENRAAVISRLKIMSNLNISEKRRPQDGRTEVNVGGRKIDVRVSTLPTQYGESIVLRLLDGGQVSLDWGSLGFSSHKIKEIQNVISQPNGIFLVAGPTGSGKTTTLYTALNQLNSDDKKIVTVEDPIEYSLEGINQVQVEPELDLSFANALRAILRQDPDIVMIGEIRDKETAEIAVRAALVGRLVLSTVHTNDSIAAIDRLVDLGVPPYLLGSTLRGILSQRLVRRVCCECDGVGCELCIKSGYKGRIAVSELLNITPKIETAIAEGEGRNTLIKVAKEEGFRTFLEEANKLVGRNTTTRSEIERALGEQAKVLNTRTISDN